MEITNWLIIIRYRESYFADLKPGGLKPDLIGMHLPGVNYQFHQHLKRAFSANIFVPKDCKPKTQHCNFWQYFRKMHV